MSPPSRSWSDYVELLKSGGELTKLFWTTQDPQLPAELYRQLAMNVSLGYFLYFQSDADHPDWAPFLNSVFLLQPNPDDVYLLARIHGGGVYRISGDRGTVRLLTFDIGCHMMGLSDQPGKTLAQLSADELEMDQDGHFELLLSRERPKGHVGNWQYLDPQAEHVLARFRSYDWRGERDPRLAIERLDRSALKPRLTAEQVDVKLRELFGGFPQRLSRMWLEHQQRLLERGMVNKLEFFQFGGGLKAQAYWQGIFDLAPGEVLVLESELPQQALYWNVQLNDPLFNTVEYVYRQSSLNGHQARIDDDGRFRAVISAEDPGIANWLDTGGYRQGTLIGRWYACSSHPMPSLKKVPLAQLSEHLSAGTSRLTPDERRKALQLRREGAQLRRRW